MIVGLVFAGLVVAWIVFQWIDDLPVRWPGLADLLIAVTSLGLLCLPAGVLWSQWHSARVRSGWPVVEATVVETSREGAASYVQYEYLIDGAKHRGDAHPAGDLGRGDPISVHVDPEDARTSVFDPGDRGLAAPVLVTIATLGVLYGVVRFVRWLRRRLLGSTPSP